MAFEVTIGITAYCWIGWFTEVTIEGQLWLFEAQRLPGVLGLEGHIGEGRRLTVEINRNSKPPKFYKGYPYYEKPGEFFIPLSAQVLPSIAPTGLE